MDYFVVTYKFIFRVFMNVCSPPTLTSMIFYPDPGFLGLLDEYDDGVCSLDKILLPVGIVLVFFHA